jgi:hypothetical protein
MCRILLLSFAFSPDNELQIGPSARCMGSSSVGGNQTITQTTGAPNLHLQFGIARLAAGL